MNVRKPQTRLIKAIGIPSLAFLVGFLFANSRFLSETLCVPQNLIPLNSTEGEQLLMTSKAREDYTPLSVYFVSQKNPAFCGVASIAMVLNALSIPAPVAPELGNAHVFNQDNVFKPSSMPSNRPCLIPF